MLTLHYFAQFREELGQSQEQINADALQTVDCVIQHLRDRGAPWTDVLGQSKVQVAVNQTLAKPETPIRSGDEVAFFPPVTGG